jgi:hypothetical protein
MENTTSVFERAKKLKELADRGVGGERDNARVMYDRYCKKHNLSDEAVNNFRYGKASRYVSMSDEDFLKEMISDAIPLIFSMILKRNRDEQTRAEDENKGTQFLNKFVKAIAERHNIKT